MLDFSTIRAVLLDVDGVLYRGKTVLPGGRALLALLDQHDIPYACITNNGSLTPQQYEAKLADMGLQIPASHLLTSALATSYYLREHYPRDTSVYAIGMHGLHEALFSDGYFVAQQQNPQVVVLGPDFAVTYEKLKWGCIAIRAGAAYILTNPDRTLPTEEGFIPDAGALSAALEASTDVEPLVIGKPQPTMFQVALHLLGAVPTNTLMIGDRLETDIAGAVQTGLRNVLVLTGASRREDVVHSPYQPDGVYEGLPQIVAAWQQTL